MIGIGTLIGIATSIYQAVQTLNRSDPASQKTDQLFSQLDANGKGSIDGADLQNAFDKIAAQATLKADELFAKLDADSDGQITKSEFSSSINKLADQLDQHYASLRMKSAMGGSTGFTQEQLSGMASDLAGNFAKADADGDGKLTIREAVTFQKTNPTTAPAGNDDRNVELMLQVMRLMQAYGPQQTATENPVDKQAQAKKISIVA